MSMPPIVQNPFKIVRNPKRRQSSRATARQARSRRSVGPSVSMPSPCICIRSFTSGGQSYKAGQTFCSASTDVVRRYPANFEPA